MLSSLIYILFSVDTVIYEVVSDLKLASSAFSFKPSQLRGVLGFWIAEGLQVIVPPRRLIRLVYWMRPPPRVAKRGWLL